MLGYGYFLESQIHLVNSIALALVGKAHCFIRVMISFHLVESEIRSMEQFFH